MQSQKKISVWMISNSQADWTGFDDCCYRVFSQPHRADSRYFEVEDRSSQVNRVEGKRYINDRCVDRDIAILNEKLS